jgi:hypothetical protein
VVTPTAYHELLTQFVPENPPFKLNESDLTESTICVNSWYGAGATALSHGAVGCDLVKSWFTAGVTTLSHCTLLV